MGFYEYCKTTLGHNNIFNHLEIMEFDEVCFFFFNKCSSAFCLPWNKYSLIGMFLPNPVV